MQKGIMLMPILENIQVSSVVLYKKLPIHIGQKNSKKVGFFLTMAIHYFTLHLFNFILQALLPRFRTKIEENRAMAK